MKKLIFFSITCLFVDASAISEAGKQRAFCNHDCAYKFTSAALECGARGEGEEKFKECMAALNESFAVCRAGCQVRFEEAKLLADDSSKL